MNNTNDLSGLTLHGFDPSVQYVDTSIFDDKKELIKKVAIVINKYFSKSNVFCYSSSSYGIKHYVENYYNQFYIPNGILIYAMHLEGFLLKRDGDGKNAFFNIKEIDVRSLKNAPDILNKLKSSGEADVFIDKQLKNFKYDFKRIIDSSFFKEDLLKKDVIRVVSKEIGVKIDVLREWFNTKTDEKTIIPENKLDQLRVIFGLKSSISG